MIGAKRVAIMMSREKNVVAIKIDQRNVRGESLLGMNENKGSAGLEGHAAQDFAKGHTFPNVVEATPPRDTVKVTSRSNSRKRFEFSPS